MLCLYQKALQGLNPMLPVALSQAPVLEESNTSLLSYFSHCSQHFRQETQLALETMWMYWLKGIPVSVWNRACVVRHIVRLFLSFLIIYVSTGQKIEEAMPQIVLQRRGR
jgi:hypothetical protein